MTAAPAPAAAEHGPASPAFSVDPWDPGYGLAFGDEMDGGAVAESSAELDLDFEMPAARWRPVDPDQALQLPGLVLFLDGVRRIDARVWMHGGGVHGERLQPDPAIAASYAAGLVACDGDEVVGHAMTLLRESGAASPGRHRPRVSRSH